MISIASHLRHLRRLIAAAIVALAVFGTHSAAMAQTEIDITGGRVDPLPIAISPFLAGGGAERAAVVLSASGDRYAPHRAALIRAAADGNLNRALDALTAWAVQHTNEENAA